MQISQSQTSISQSAARNSARLSTRILSLILLAMLMLAATGCGVSTSIGVGYTHHFHRHEKKVGKVRLEKETVHYTHEGDECVGTFVWGVGGGLESGKRPGVMIVHAWKGPGKHEMETAERLARQGMLAFVADMYGKDLRPTTNQEAGAAAGKFRSNRPLQRARAAAGLATLKAHKLCDADNTAALGFCFGGGTVLELARSGADTKGVISFHGNLDTPDINNIKAYQGHVLVLHGADDPLVNDAAVAGLHKEMREAGTAWEFIAYGDAVHSFSDPYAGSDKSRGSAYHPVAAARSWMRTLDLLAELFAEK